MFTFKIANPRPIYSLSQPGLYGNKVLHVNGGKRS